MFKEILLTVDLNDEASWSKALPTAVQFCRAFDARLHVITVVPDFGMTIVAQYFPEGYEKQMLQEADKKLGEFVDHHVPDDVSARHIVGHGTIYEEVLRAAKELNVDLIIMASHRPELRDYLIGPNAARVMRHATASVLVVRD
ncbi:MAG: universal stress protein [Kiloniellales bacterium]